jgi:hypothetical protein
MLKEVLVLLKLTNHHIKIHQQGVVRGGGSHLSTFSYWSSSVTRPKTRVCNDFTHAESVARGMLVASAIMCRCCFIQKLQKGVCTHPS